VRVLVATQPAYGHLHPLVPLCQGLSDAGHDVTVATAASFRPQVQAAGLAGVAAGIDWLESDLEAAFPDYAEHRARGDSKAFLQSEIFAWRTARAMASDLEALGRERRVDLMIREPWEFGAAIAATVLGVPCVLHGIGPVANVEEVLTLGNGRLSEQAQMLGIAEHPRDWLGGALYLDACPPLLQSPSAAFDPPRRQLLRPQIFDTTDGVSEPPGWLAGPRDRPVVYVGLGTVMNRWHGLLQRLVAELAPLDLELAVTTGPGLNPGELGAGAPNVHVERYVPLTTLLPYCDAVVCHAGWGTTIAALAHGLPVVAVPLAADGPRNAGRCQQAGIGRVVQADDVGRGAVADALGEVVSNLRFTEAAHAAREQIDQMPLASEAVKVIESLWM
jgi:UDP:flavonoid glycosyltransferase YjiC (YdhE family)